MAVIFQTTFSNGFSRMETYEFRLKFNWNLLLGVQSTIFQHCFREWLGADQAIRHYLNQWWLSLLMHIFVTQPRSINSLAPKIFKWNLKWIIFNIIVAIDGWGISFEIALRRLTLDLADDKSTLVQVTAWCRKATSCYLSQCGSSSMMP